MVRKKEREETQGPPFRENEPLSKMVAAVLSQEDIIKKYNLLLGGRPLTSAFY